MFVDKSGLACYRFMLSADVHSFYTPNLVVLCITSIDK